MLCDGPFALSRNPINLGDTLGYCAIALLLGNLWPWLLLPGLLYLMNRTVIRPDERQLLELFGQPYHKSSMMAPGYNPSIHRGFEHERTVVRSTPFSAYRLRCTNHHCAERLELAGAIGGLVAQRFAGATPG
ncbi:MAG: hypothetical protein MUW57_07135 [Pseudomonas sp.]|nr:hypothetical protein [Pseudomonas sp.]